MLRAKIHLFIRRIWLALARLRWRCFSHSFLVLDDAARKEEIDRALRHYGVPNPSDRFRFLRRLSFEDFFWGPPVLITRWPGTSRKAFLPPGVFFVDGAANPKAAWEWGAVAEMIGPGRGGPPATEVVATMLSQLRAESLPIAYVFGTGPSLAAASGHDWSDGYRIVCNTIVKDAELWNSLKPHVIVAGDALYHFSHTRHAQAFMADLKARLSEHPAWVLYPERFDPVVRPALAGFASWLVPLSPSGGDVHNVLPERAALPAYLGNVLPFLLLPVACALAKDVRLLGFDGRGPADKLFWKNSDRHSYPDLIVELSRDFPAFFQANVPKADPLRYIRAVHGSQLEDSFALAEREGFVFSLLYPSFTEVLQRRHNPAKQPPKK
jgi:hypothetical protein